MNLFDILQLAENNIDEFTDEFLEWLPENIHIVHAFKREAFRVIYKGYKHYSGRTILEVLRHHSALEEKDGAWKLNNNHIPYLCRLFGLMHPEHADLFEYREIRKPKETFCLVG